MTAVAGVIWLVPFWGKQPPGLRNIHDPDWIMRLGPCLLGIMGIVFGLIPGWVSDNLIEPAVRSFHPSREDIRLALFHGFNIPLLLSAVTLTAGGTIFLFRQPIRSGFESFRNRLPVSFHGLYLSGIERFLQIAVWITGRLQHGSLCGYMVVILVVLAAALWCTWMLAVGSSLRFPEVVGHPAVIGLVVLTGTAAVVAVRAATKLAAVAALGTVGAGVALIFLMFGAPDIAMTQLLVETLTVVIVSIVMLRLPSLHMTPKRPPVVRILHGLLSGSIGLGITLLLMGILAFPLDRSLTGYYETGSYLLAHGRNIVNVILVDFRSLDTLGEITVVVLASWAVTALLRKPGVPDAPLDLSKS
jgi:multicomponent Na+:H+ antiporter subunit A